MAKSLGLTDGLPTGGAGLGDLPEESPKDETKVPATIARMRTLVFLGQSIRTDPLAKESFKLMEGGSGGGAKETYLLGEVASPEREVRCVAHLRQRIYCPIDINAIFF
jgi:hypothetical protein